MDMENLTALPARLEVGAPLEGGLRRALVVAKATYRLEPAGLALDDQAPLPVTVKDTVTELGVLPADVVARRDARFEVGVLGRAHRDAAQGAQLLVSLAVGDHRKTVSLDARLAGAPVPAGIPRAVLFRDRAPDESEEAAVAEVERRGLAPLPIDSSVHSERSYRVTGEGPEPWAVPSEDRRLRAAPGCVLDAAPSPETPVVLEGFSPFERVAFRFPSIEVVLEARLGDRTAALSLDPHALWILPEQGRALVVFRRTFCLEPPNGQSRRARLIARTAARGGWS
jgi:hypothetical protein